MKPSLRPAISRHAFVRLKLACVVGAALLLASCAQPHRHGGGPRAMGSAAAAPACDGPGAGHGRAMSAEEMAAMRQRHHGDAAGMPCGPGMGAQMGMGAPMGAMAPAAAGDAPVGEPQRRYLGWRVFQARCAQCHGPDATGGPQAPDLLPRVAGMSEGRFLAVVLQRYTWSMPADQARREGAAREALIDDMVRRREGQVQMPAWGGEPMVDAHIADLYAYLSSRASGALGPGRPGPPVK